MTKMSLERRVFCEELRDKLGKWKLRRDVTRTWKSGFVKLVSQLFVSCLYLSLLWMF